ETDLAPAAPRRPNRLARLAWATGGILVSLAFGVAADRLIRDLFARAEWLGWAGLAVLALFVVALAALLAREMLALRRLHTLDQLRKRAADVLASDKRDAGRAILHTLR